MSLLNNLLSSIDPTAVPKPPSTPGVRQTPAASGPKPSSRPVASTNGVSQPQPQPLKRKADGQSDGGQAKVPRKDGPPSRPGTPGQIARPNSVNRSVPASDAPKTKPSTPAPSIPYRGTAASGGSILAKPLPGVSKKPATVAATPNASAKPAISMTKPATSTTSAATSQPAKKGYAAMLQKAKEREQTKTPSLPVKIEPTKILSKKEREALRAQAKGKKPVLNAHTKQTKPSEVKSKVPERSKSVGYQGTARPIKKPVETGYKGTARPSSATPGGVGKSGGSSAARAKSKPQRRDDGYANWSDLDDMDDDEEDYASEDLSDMEGGIWDVEEEEQMALKVAKKEDAEALAEENEHKRQKEERKRKLMSLAASTKRKY